MIPFTIVASCAVALTLCVVVATAYLIGDFDTGRTVAGATGQNARSAALAWPQTVQLPGSWTLEHAGLSDAYRAAEPSRAWQHRPDRVKTTGYLQPVYVRTAADYLAAAGITKEWAEYRT